MPVPMLIRSFELADAVVYLMKTWSDDVALPQIDRLHHVHLSGDQLEAFLASVVSPSSERHIKTVCAGVDYSLTPPAVSPRTR
jgi:hypothetical protein